MGYRIELATSGAFVRVVVNETVTTALAQRFSVAFLAAGKAAGVSAFLIDVRGVRNASSIVDNYTYAYHDAPAIELPGKRRAAYLVDPDDKSHDFVEIAMRNAGYDVRKFTDEDEAVKWLENPDPRPGFSTYSLKG